MTEPGCWAIPGHDRAACLARGRRHPGAYCIRPRCYCGGCPWFLPIDVMPTYTPDAYTAFDRRAVLSSTGRRASLAAYRAAQGGSR